MYGKYNPRPPETVFYPLQTFAISLSLHFLDVETMRKPLLLIVLLLAVLAMHAEGTKEIMPTAEAKGRVHMYNSFSPFAHYNCAIQYRINIKIKNINEKIYFGFGKTVNPAPGGFSSPQQVYDVTFRLRRPNGDTAIFTTPVPTSGQGYIATYNQAVIGPSQIASGGYNAKVFTANMTGDWWLEFHYPAWASGARREFEFFDITVASGTTPKPGRVWSQGWQFTATNDGNASDNEFTGKVYVYSDDGVVTKVDFNGFKPIVFNVFCNQYGVYNTGNFVEDRKSSSNNAGILQYKIFLNDPDITIYPTGAFGQITGPVTTNSFCNGGTNIMVPVNKAGKVEILLEQNPAAGVQPEDRQLLEDVVPGNNTIYWDGLNGLGQPLANGSDLILTVTYINGLTNLPLWDPDINTNGFIVDLVRPTGNRPKMFWDDTDVGGIQELDGCILETGCHTFGISVGNNNTINTWWYASTTSTAPVTFEYRYTSYATASAPLCPGQTLVINGQTITTPGSYPFTLVNYMGCDSLVTYTVNSAANPVVNLPASQTLCPGEEITLDAGAGFASYLWSTTATTQTIVASQPGTYTVTVTNAAGCQASDSFVYSSSGPPPNPIKHN